MKQRITYINHPGEEAPDPTQIPFEDGVLSLRSWKAAKQDRVTVDFQELPQEIWQVLKLCEELHVRWVAERPYDALAPLSSRMSPGLHIFYTPGAEGKSMDPLCPSLQKIFDTDLRCSLPEDTFITTTGFSSSKPTLQFYESLSSPKNLVTYIQRKICPESDTGCQERASSLSSADSIDIDYDSSSHSFVVYGYWSKSPKGDGWTEDIGKDGTGFEKVEVGLLALETSSDPEELSVSGFLGVAGESDKLKPTLFSFPSRHHPLSDSSVYTTSFQPPTGLHPTMKLSFPTHDAPLEPPTTPPGYTCSLNTYLTLPSTTFADKYQLSTTDPLFLNSHNLLSLRSISGETDLEAPDWVVPRWGSTLLLELATPSDADTAGTPWEITIPLHLRYLHPSSSGTRQISIPWPTVFWACETDSHEEMSINPFDRTHLGFESLFGPRTLFYYFNPDPSPAVPRDDGRPAASRGLVEEIDVPVLTVKDGEGGALQVKMVELGTVVVVVFGFVWVLWKLGAVFWGSGVGRGGDGRRERGTEGKKER